jgi:CRP-like cAMP-binding protein
LAGSYANPDGARSPSGAKLNPPKQRPYRNRVLAALPRTEINRLKPHLTPVTLDQEMVLLQGKATHGYFLEQGLASVVVTLENGNSVEVGVIGIDGVVGLSVLLGGDTAPGTTFMQIGGSGYSIKAEILKQEFERTGALRQHLQRYIQGFLAQSAQTAACNRQHNIEERLGRWLLACHDRIGADQLRLTHDFLGQMLGAPRSTVTLAAGLLQKAGLIDYSRGLVTVKNREELEGVACECYRIVRDEFRRLDLL